jgi:hypothetical protein
MHAPGAKGFSEPDVLIALPSGIIEIAHRQRQRQRAIGKRLPTHCGALYNVAPAELEDCCIAAGDPHAGHAVGVQRHLDDVARLAGCVCRRDDGKRACIGSGELVQPLDENDALPPARDGIADAVEPEVRIGKVQPEGARVLEPHDLPLPRCASEMVPVGLAVRTCKLRYGEGLARSRDLDLDPSKSFRQQKVRVGIEGQSGQVATASW